MRYLYSTLVLAAAAITQVVAGPVQHAHSMMHIKKSALNVEYAMKERSIGNSTSMSADSADACPTITGGTYLTATDAARLTSLCFIAKGVNSATNNGEVWYGTYVAYTSEFINNSGQALILVIWGPSGSWVNAVQPYITYSLAAGSQVSISFASGQSGAWSAIYSDTTLVNGQVSNTWGEYTMSLYGVVDVSREVNMSGHTMSIVGPECTTDMSTCVFVCSNGANVCGDSGTYALDNCATGSQSGASYGTYDGNPSGGCGGMGNGASFVTTLS